MRGELCRILTDDGLELNGFYVGRSQRSEVRRQKSEVSGRTPHPQSPVPNPYCVVHVHGWDGNFYENRFIDHTAAACSRLGVGFAAFNNRGHDYIADILRIRRDRNSGLRRRRERLDYVQLGGVFERFRDGRLDVKAAVDFAEARGHRKVFLQGHSLGAMKATHYVAQARYPRVAGLVLLSPADTLGWIREKLGRRLPGALAYAQRLVRQGRGRELVPPRFYDSPVSVRTFVEAFGPKSLTGIFNISRTARRDFPELAAVSVPVLLAVGTVEEYFVGPAQEFVEGIGGYLEQCPSFAGVVLEGAPHNYLGYEAACADALQDWIEQRTRGRA